MQDKNKYVNLLDRAHEIEDWAEKHFIDSNGVVYSLIDKHSEKPITDSFFTSQDTPFIIPGFTPAEISNYENCGMTTGSYLQSQIYRYAVEKNKESLQKAQRCFNALKYIYNIGKQYEEGFFPKIYGNKFTNQTSTDQVLYTVMSMDNYYRYAEKEEQIEIGRMITFMVNFWVKRDYKYDYYTMKNMQWPIGRFTSLLLLAYKHSGDSKFKDEYNRLLSTGVNKFPVEEQLRPKLGNEIPATPYEKKMNAWLISHRADALTMEVIELDYLISNDADNSWLANWKKSIQQMWDEGKLALSDDGKMYIQVLVDMDTKEIRRPEPGLIAEPRTDLYTEEAKFWDWVGFRYVSGARTGWSTMAARAGVQAYRHLKDNTIIPVVLNILSHTDLVDLTYFDDPERFLPELKHKTRFYSGDAMGNWLWAYWQGRYEGIIEPSL